MLTLGIESSCDETAAAVVEDGRRVLASVIASQAARHGTWKGVVPELAAREHVKAVLPVIRKALDDAGVTLADIGLIAVTREPGLVGALLVGVAAAEALSLATGTPVVGVNHIEAHIGAPWLADGEAPSYPLISLVVSGGHTHFFLSSGPCDHLLLGATLDDAAGEAFDKIAAVLGLGYPGGPAVEKAARTGNPDAFRFKRPLLDPKALDVSFSGLKTAVKYRCFEQDPDGRPLKDMRPGVRTEDVAASFQAAVVDTLVTKAAVACALHRTPRIAIGGGVACNGPLREALLAKGKEAGFEVFLTPPKLCTDNAAMVASQGYFRFRERGPDTLPLVVRPRASWPRAGAVAQPLPHG